jgi:hypothetical protein
MQNSVALDGNPEPDLVHATGCKQPTLRLKLLFDCVKMARPVILNEILYC